MQTYEEQKAFVSKLNVIDDVFFQKMAEDREVAEEILRIILEKPKLRVIDSKVQRFLRNISAHSVVLDLICEDENHSIINCEVQKEDYKELPDVYIIFISKFDTFHENRTIYHIDRVINETGTVVENGTHEIYVNTAIDDKSDIAELMQYFKKSVGQNPKFPKTCRRVDYFKKTREGASIMCKLVEDYAAEKLRQAEIQTASNFLRNGVSVDIVAKSIPSLTREFIVELSKKIMQPSNI